MKNHENKDKEDELPLKESILMIQDFLKYLFLRWYLLIPAIFIGGYLGYYYNKDKPVMYNASTTFVLENTRSTVSGVAAILGVGGTSTGQGLFEGESLFELYRSRKLIQEVLLSPLPSDSSQLLVQRLVRINEDLTERVENNSRVSKFLEDTDNLLLPSQQSLRFRDSIMNVFVRHVRGKYLNIEKLNKEANIIVVEIESEDEEFSKAFNDKIVKDVNALYIQMKSGKTSENVAILEHKVDSVRALLSSAIYSAAITKDNTPNLNPTRQSQREAPLQQSRLVLESNRAMLVELQRNLETAKIAMSRESPLIEVLDEATYPLDKKLPNIRLWMFVGAFLAFIIVVGAILLFYSYRMIMRS